MCFIEYDWTTGLWKFRIGDDWTDFQGVRSWETLEDARAYLAGRGCSLTKTDTRTYEVKCVPSVHDFV